MTTRRFTRGVTAATRATPPPKVTTFGVLEAGDEFRTDERGGRFRLIDVNLDASTGAVTAVNAVTVSATRKGMLRSFAPERIVMPSKRAINNQRRRRAAETQEETG